MTGRARIAEAGTVSHAASRTLLAGAILLLLTAAGALAAPVRIVTARELSAELSATGRTPVVLDGRASPEFPAGHVPGSLRVDSRGFSGSSPGGAPDHVVRTVTENCRTLKFDHSGFEDN